MLVRTENKNLARDIKSNGLVSVDNKELAAYKRKKKSLQRVESMEAEMAALRDEMEKIKAHINNLRKTMPGEL